MGVAVWDVQIPLWTIVTASEIWLLPSQRGSDSSMDDCNDEPFKVTLHPDRCSDSSMDDCNHSGSPGALLRGEFRFLYGRL